MTTPALTQQVIETLISRWAEARDSESAPDEIAVFDTAITQAQALLSHAATPDEIEALVRIAPAYPIWGRRSLLDLAAAKRSQGSH